MNNTDSGIVEFGDFHTVYYTLFVQNKEELINIVST